jgi:hypothetical protein
LHARAASGSLEGPRSTGRAAMHVCAAVAFEPAFDLMQEGKSIRSVVAF